MVSENADVAVYVFCFFLFLRFCGKFSKNFLDCIYVSFTRNFLHFIFTQIKKKFRTKSNVPCGVLEEPLYVKPTLQWADCQLKWVVSEFRSLISLFLWLPMRLRQRIHSDLYVSIGKVPTHLFWFGIISINLPGPVTLIFFFFSETFPKFYMSTFFFSFYYFNL